MTTTAEPTVSREDPTASSGGPMDRLLGRLRGQEEGATLVCVAALHGNEPAGVAALARVFARLSAAELRGEFLGLLGNRKALAQGRRYLDEDLNRLWVPRRMARVRSGAGPLNAEEEELRDLDRELRAALAAARGRVFVLDLHTTSGPGPAFAVLDDTLTNREFALRFPVPLILGLEEELDGPMLHHLAEEGAVSLAFEGGRHGDPASIDRAEAAIWVALAAAGALLDPGRPEPTAAFALLESATGGLPRVTEIRHRHAIGPEDGFRMHPGYASFSPVAKSQAIADDVRGPVRVKEAGYLLMPLYQAQGNDGYFLIGAVAPVWLKLSKLLRRWGAERFVHWVPGVRRVRGRPGTYVVSRRFPRRLTLGVLHLLGFRRHRRDGGNLVVSRRADDR